MSYQVLALLLTLAVFALLAAWVPLLDFLQRRWQARNPAGRPALRGSVTQRHVG
jgi:predicted membrane metal-binding protein